MQVECSTFENFKNHRSGPKTRLDILEVWKVSWRNHEKWWHKLLLFEEREQDYKEEINEIEQSNKQINQQLKEANKHIKNIEVKLEEAQV